MPLVPSACTSKRLNRDSVVGLFLWNGLPLELRFFSMVHSDTFCSSLKTRGVQYVHCVMHKCIMVKLGGNEKHRKYVNKQVNFTKSGRKFVKVKEGIIIFRKQGKMY